MSAMTSPAPDRQLLRFTKHHGAGNDFLVLIDPGSTGPLPGDLVRALCDRRFGVGADGVIQVVDGGTAAEIGMILQNADGREAEMSGNGMRCLAQAAVLSALVLIPLWIFAPSTGVIVAGAFLMQFMVQGAWGVIPAHINELSPDAIRGFFPGFAYQLGVLCASSITYMQARMAEHFTYSLVMGVSMTIVLIVGAIVISLGPERRGVVFGADASG